MNALPPPRPIPEVHWCESVRKRAQPQSFFSDDDEIREILKRIWMPVAFGLTAS
jgi:hypothetical protein